MLKTFATKRRLDAWSYTLRPIIARCRIDNQTLTIKVKISRPAVLQVPDVLTVEAIAKALTEAPTTVEEFAVAFYEALNSAYIVECAGETDTHGEIACRIE